MTAMATQAQPHAASNPTNPQYSSGRSPREMLWTFIGTIPSRSACRTDHAIRPASAADAASPKRRSKGWKLRRV